MTGHEHGVPSCYVRIYSISGTVPLCTVLFLQQNCTYTVDSRTQLRTMCHY